MSGASDSDQDQQIAAYLDDRLDAAALAAFEQRLTSEPALARRLAAHLLLEVELRGQRTAPSARQPVVQKPIVRQTTERQPASTKKIARRHARSSTIRWPAILAGAAALIVAVMLGWPAARSAPSASVVEVDLVVASTATAAVSVDGSRTPPTVLRLGQTLRVPPRATATLRWRGEATEAVITPSGGEAVVRLSENGLTLDAGAVDAVVAPRVQAFHITAGDAVATVLGTRFRVERQGPRTLLAVTSGRVELRQGEVARVVGAGGSAIADVSGVVMNGAATTGIDLERGLFARWSGDGLDGNRLRDLGPGGHHGDATGVQAVAGRSGKALQVDGERSLVTIPHSDDLTIGDPAKPYAVACWLRLPPGSTKEMNLLSKGRTTAQPGPTLAMCLLLSGGNRIDLYRWNENPVAGAEKLEGSGWKLPRLDDGAWHHLAVVCEHATLRRCYHNGVDIGTDTTPWRNDTSNRSRWTLGRLENMGFTEEQPLTGDLEDVRVYDRVLTAAEVAALGAVGR